MIRADITWANGGRETIYAESFSALFEKLQGYDRYIALDAREIQLKDMRQGR